MNATPFISIIVPVYNDEKYIARCLNSLVNQTAKNIEILIIDDCSNDNSLKVIEDFSRFNNFHIIKHKKNLGPLISRIDGIKCAKGEYIMFVDSDDYITLDACEKLLPIAKKGEFDIIHFNVFFSSIFFKNNKNWELSYSQHLMPFNGCLFSSDIFQFYKKHYDGRLWNKIYKKTLLNEVLKYIKCKKLYFAEDNYIYCIAALLAKRYIGKVDLKLYYYNRGLGIIETQLYTLRDFKKLCKRVQVDNGIKRAYKKINGKGDEYKKYVLESRTASLYDLLSYIHRTKHKRLSLLLIIFYWHSLQDIKIIWCYIKRHLVRNKCN